MKLTKQFKLGLIALICGAFTASSVRAAMTYSQGDMLLAVRQTGNNQTYMVDLGSAISFRDASSASSLSITGIAADMSATFGTGWYTDSTVFASIVGGNNSSTPLTGDGTGGTIPTFFNRSIYVGKSGTGSASDPTFSNLATNTVSSMSNTIGNTFGNVFAAGTATGNNTVGTLIPTSTTNDYTDLIPPTAGNYFGGLTTSTEGNANSTFNLYRILANNSNAVNALGNGVSQFQGSFSLSNAGVVSFTPEVTAAPEPSRVILLGLGLSGLLMRRRRKA